MLAKTRSETIICTPELARHLRGTCHFPRQREISVDNINRLVMERNHNRFIEGTQIFFAVLPDGHSYILNGNHTLEMVAASSFPTELTFTYSNVADMNEASRLYGRFDLQRVRSWRVQLTAAGLDVGVSYDWQARSGAALACLIRGFKRVSSGTEPTLAARSVDNRLNLILEYKEAISLLTTATHGRKRNAYTILRRAPVLAVALETFRYQPLAAEEFWGEFARDDGLQNGQPAKSLLDYLRDRPVNGSNSEFQARACIQAWNFFFKGDVLQLCKPSVMKPPIILGTPWDGEFDPIAAYLNAPLPTSPKPTLRPKSSVKTGKRLTKSSVTSETVIEPANASE